MKMTLRAVLIASIYGIVLSIIGSAIVGYFALFFAGGYLKSPFEAVPWFLKISILPSALLAIACSLIKPYIAGSKLQLHLTAIAIAFFAVAACGSVGAVTVEALSRNLSTVNISGYLTWCWVYALLLLPLSYPLVLILLRLVPASAGQSHAA